MGTIRWYVATLLVTFVVVVNVGCVIPGPSGASLQPASSNGLAGFGDANYSPSVSYVVTWDTLTRAHPALGLHLARSVA
jgi:hypothetical protein